MALLAYGIPTPFLAMRGGHGGGGGRRWGRSGKGVRRGGDSSSGIGIIPTTPHRSRRRRPRTSAAATAWAAITTTWTMPWGAFWCTGGKGGA